jgi:hypothetical protein
MFNEPLDRKLVASGLTEDNADFICSVHAVLPDLVGRLHEAFDEADRADYDKDSRECRVAELEIALAEAQTTIRASVPVSDRWVL